MNIFIDTEDMEERYGEQLYQDYLKGQLDLYKSVIDEVREYIEKLDKKITPGNPIQLFKYEVNDLLEILDKAKGE